MKKSNTYHRFGLVILVLLLHVYAPERARAQSSPDYTMTRNAITTTGQPSQSSHFQLRDATGQVSPLGMQTISNYRLDPGFFGMTAIGSLSSIKTPDVSDVPQEFKLSPAYPNPFNPQTTIAYQLPHAGEVTLTVYNVRGHVVRTMTADTQPVGCHSVVWDGCDQSGQAVASGTYLYRLEVRTQNHSSYRMTRKMLLMK